MKSILPIRQENEDEANNNKERDTGLKPFHPTTDNINFYAVLTWNILHAFLVKIFPSILP